MEAILFDPKADYDVVAPNPQRPKKKSCFFLSLALVVSLLFAGALVAGFGTKLGLWAEPSSSNVSNAAHTGNHEYDKDVDEGTSGNTNSKSFNAPTHKCKDDSPVVVKDDEIKMNMNEPMVYVNVLSNDKATSGEKLALADGFPEGAKYGKCRAESTNDRNRVLYVRPVDNHVGPDSCIYQACDSKNNCGNARLTINFS